MVSMVLPYPILNTTTGEPEPRTSRGAAAPVFDPYRDGWAALHEIAGGLAFDVEFSHVAPHSRPHVLDRIVKDFQGIVRVMYKCARISSN